MPRLRHVTWLRSVSTRPNWSGSPVQTLISTPLTMSAADDPFTCRLSFTRLLTRLNASAGASKQCAQFALRNRELDEDLFSVILEQLQSVPPPISRLSPLHSKVS